jgi:hypothetical protein
MILNALNNQFIFHMGPNFFYPEIHQKWTPVIKRLKLPYESLEDFMNAAVQSISFPSITLDTVEQTQQHFRIAYRPGKELEPLFDKNLTVTFKLSEGFITYWILFEQIELFIKLYEVKKPFWDPLFVSFLDHHGFELVAFSFEKIIPTALSQFEISYATTAAEFNTFTLNLQYNRFKVKNRLTDSSYDIKNS